MYKLKLMAIVCLMYGSVQKVVVSRPVTTAAADHRQQMTSSVQPWCQRCEH
jgi:hypothetical protein